jgi:hypothetical protein
LRRVEFSKAKQGKTKQNRAVAEIRRRVRILAGRSPFREARLRSPAPQHCEAAHPGKVGRIGLDPCISDISDISDIQECTKFGGVCAAKGPR